MNVEQREPDVSEYRGVKRREKISHLAFNRPVIVDKASLPPASLGRFFQERDIGGRTDAEGEQPDLMTILFDESKERFRVTHVSIGEKNQIRLAGIFLEPTEARGQCGLDFGATANGELSDVTDR